jgi:translation initiation factor IF-3
MIKQGNTRDVRPKGNPVGEEITANELRVIDENGEQAGIMLREAALSLADRRGLDLVLISPTAKPPVAKVMDFGKYRYDQQKREKEAKKKQRVIEIKEIRLSTFIDQHDLDVKANMAKRFLTDGDKLKVSLRFKGRERGRTDRGFEVMDRFVEVIKEYGLPEKRPALEGRSLIMIVNPVPPKKEKASKSENTEAAATEAAVKEAPQAEKAPKKETNPAGKQPRKKGPSDELDL